MRKSRLAIMNTNDTRRLPLQEKQEVYENDEVVVNSQEVEDNLDLDESVDDETLHDIYTVLRDLYKKERFRMLTLPPFPSDPYLKNYRLCFYLLKAFDQFYFKLKHRMDEDKRVLVARARSYAMMEKVLQEAVVKVDQLREEVKTYRFEEDVQDSALSLMNIRYEELCLEAELADTSGDMFDKDLIAQSDSHYKVFIDSGAFSAQAFHYIDRKFNELNTRDRRLCHLNIEGSRLDKRIRSVERIASRKLNDNEIARRILTKVFNSKSYAKKCQNKRKLAKETTS